MPTLADTPRWFAVDRSVPHIPLFCFSPTVNGELGLAGTRLNQQPVLFASRVG